MHFSLKCIDKQYLHVPVIGVQGQTHKEKHHQSNTHDNKIQTK